MSDLCVYFNPSYQRDLVWTPQQKEALIETIFDHGAIGCFAFAYHDSLDLPLYEIVDGKQRLSTLVEFSQDQFPVRGRYYSELSMHDMGIFNRAPVTVFQLENASLRDILVLFLRINRCGTPVDNKHIAKVRALLTSL